MLGGRLLGWRPAAAVEFAPHCREILLRRQRDGVLPLFPVWDDVRTFRREGPLAPFFSALGGLASGGRLVVTGGFPCQPYSTAGRRAGPDDPRNLWPETARVLREVGPRVAFLENVPGLVSFDYFGEILGDLAGLGYDAEWDVVSAGGLGAPHLRRRLWLLAFLPDAVVGGLVGGELGVGICEADHFGTVGEMADSEVERWGDRRVLGHVDGPGCEEGRGGGQPPVPAERGGPVPGGHPPAGWWSADPADFPVRPMGDPEGPDDQAGQAEGIGGEGAQVEHRGAGGDSNPWGVESRLGRVADGVADRVDRLRAIGNGQVAVVAAVAFVRLAVRAGLDLRRWAPGLFGPPGEEP